MLLGNAVTMRNHLVSSRLTAQSERKDFGSEKRQITDYGSDRVRGQNLRSKFGNEAASREREKLRADNSRSSTRRCETTSKF